MKKILAVLLVLFFSHAFAWTQRPPLPVQQCSVQAPYGLPNVNGLQAICQQGYLVGFDPAARIPRFVIYELTPDHALGCVPRSNAFEANKFVINSARPQDYIGTIYDKGHMAPDGDLSWDPQIEYESFLMTNMTPQAGSLNRGIWKLLETSVRGWTIEHNQSYTIYSGDIYNANDKKIGNGVTVPHAFYKIVINNQTNEVAGWEFPHVPPYPNLGNNLVPFRKPISQIEQEAGVQFAFPANAHELQPGKEWAIDFAQLEHMKKAKCGPNATVD